MFDPSRIAKLPPLAIFSPEFKDKFFGVTKPKNRPCLPEKVHRDQPQQIQAEEDPEHIEPRIQNSKTPEIPDDESGENMSLSNDSSSENLSIEAVKNYDPVASAKQEREAHLLRKRKKLWTYIRGEHTDFCNTMEDRWREIVRANLESKRIME